ncbi:hypothetical protein DI43_19095 [Geobacillus sp. CAMR12739]|nr:hypothetical protein DI43_19095 [Geobacillus sp. CAMR12739]
MQYNKGGIQMLRVGDVVKGPLWPEVVEIKRCAVVGLTFRTLTGLKERPEFDSFETILGK